MFKSIKISAKSTNNTNLLKSDVYFLIKKEQELHCFLNKIQHTLTLSFDLLQNVINLYFT